MYKVCPMTFNQRTTPCIQSDCAWWADGKCAVQLIATALHITAENTDKIQNRIAELADRIEDTVINL